MLPDWNWKQIFFVVFLMSFVGCCSGVMGVAAGIEAEQQEQSHHHQKEAYYSECCRYCEKGKACGRTCISRDKKCHTVGGCACDVDSR